MKIIYLTTEYPGLTENYGGIAVVFEKEVNLLRLKGYYVDVILITSYSINNKPIPSYIKTFSFTGKGAIKGLRDRFRLISYINKNYSDKDLIVTSDFLGLVPYYIKPVKIVQLHGSLTILSIKQSKHVQWMTYLLEYFNILTANRIRSVSDSILIDSRKVFPFISKNKCAVIHNGIDIDNLGSHAINSDFDGPLNIIYIGKLSKLKGVLFLGDIINGVNGILPEVCFTIIGHDEVQDGISQKEVLKKQIKQIQNVKFIDRLPNDEIHDYIGQSKLLILPSITESLSMVVIEAFAAGRPAVSFKVGGTNEVIDDGINGYLIEPYEIQDFVDKILNILRLDEKSYCEMCLAAFNKCINNFNIEITVEQLINFYKVES
jgi:glycosyltransferase involved in cell wall biosynthesis